MRFIWPKLPTAEYISSSENRIYRKQLSVRQAVTDRRKGAGLMGKLTEAAAFYAKFAGKVLPEAYRQRNSAREELRRCSPAFIVRGGAMEEDDLSEGYLKRICCFLVFRVPRAPFNKETWCRSLTQPLRNLGRTGRRMHEMRRKSGTFWAACQRPWIRQGVSHAAWRIRV